MALGQRSQKHISEEALSLAGQRHHSQLIWAELTASVTEKLENRIRVNVQGVPSRLV